MLITDIKRVVDQISRDKGIDFEVLIKALEEALESAARKKYGSEADLEVQYNEQSGEMEVFLFKEVVEDVVQPYLQLTIKEGRKLDSECELGDSLGTKLDATSFGRIAAQSAKQVIIQKMKEAERNAVYSSFIDRKGELINGIVQRIDRGDIVVNLGQTEGVLPSRELGVNEIYRRGDRIRALILKVLQDSRGPQVILSRTHPEFLINLFKTEVPEISEGIVEVVGAAREPGSRAKIAVSSSDTDVDPVGACVGMKGSRVQNVVQELKGEKIDIIPWHIDNARFVCNALAPAEIARVIIDEDNKSMEVVVADEFLSIAIGKRGQNVRLASRLTGWHLDVTSEAKYNQAKQSSLDSLMRIKGVGLSLAAALHERGFNSAKDVGVLSTDELMEFSDLSEEDAVEIIFYAQNFDTLSKLAPVEIEPVKDEALSVEISEEDDASEENASDDEASNDEVAEDQALDIEVPDVETLEGEVSEGQTAEGEVSKDQTAEDEVSEVQIPEDEGFDEGDSKTE